MHVRLHGEALPGQIGSRRHRRRARREVEIDTPADQIDETLARRAQSAGSELEACGFRIAWPVDGEADRKRAEVRQTRQAGEQPVRGLIDDEFAFQHLRIDARIELVGAGRVDAGHDQRGLRIARRCGARVALKADRTGLAGHQRANVEPAHFDSVDIDPTPQRGAFRAALRRR